MINNGNCRLYANYMAKQANPDFNPRGDALIVAAYAQQLSQSDATECFSYLLTQLSSMNEENRNHFIHLAEQVLLLSYFSSYFPIYIEWP